MKKAFFYTTPLCEIGIAEENGAVTNLFFGDSVKPKEYCVEETPLLREAARQLREYFAEKRTVFDFPLRPEGTPFEQSVWNALLTIPFGETRTYGQIAVQIGNPKACRAVGGANGKNPIAIVIPCHRVIGAGGKMVGYTAGPTFKETLLKLEDALPMPDSSALRKMLYGYVAPVI